MVSVYSWIYMFLWASLLCIHIILSRKISFIHVLLIGLFIQIMYPLSQYPTLIHGDGFYHGLSTRSIVSADNAQIDGLYPKL